MDDGGRCLLDVINDPLLLQSFLESGSDDNSKDPQDGTSSESAVESPQVFRGASQVSNHLSSVEHLVEQSEPMGYSYAVDNPALLAQSGLSSTSSGLGGVSLVVASSSVGPQTYHHASSSGATIHHIPSSSSHNLHPHSPASARPTTPLSSLNIKSPGQGPSSVHSMPPPSPLQQTRSPLPSHTPSPAPAWSPAPPVLSPATSRTQSSMPSVAFQQSHNQILQTTCSVTQFVTALATQQSITQKLTVQQQQQLFLQQQLSPSQQTAQRLAAVTSPVVTTTAVAVPPPMVQLIPAPQSNVSLSARTSHTTVRPIQPKLPPQILPKPVTCSASNQFVTPAPATKQAPPTPVTAGQRTVGVGIQQNTAGQLVIGQGQSSVFSGPQGTILLNQIIPGMGQSPILIQGNLGNLSNLANVQGLQLTLRPPSSASPAQQLNSSNSQNNAALIAALQGPSQHAHTLFAQAKSPLHGQPTIVMANNITHAGIPSQNINLTSTAIPNTGIMSSSSQGQGFLRSNIILSPRGIVGNQGIQFQQIQTPQGPIFACIPNHTIAVPHLPLQNAALGNAQLAPVTLPMHGVMATNQGVISGLSLPSHAPQSALQQQQQQSLFGTAVPFTSHLEQPSHQVIQVPHQLAPPQVPSNHHSPIPNQHSQSVEHSPKPPSPPKPSKVPSVNLEELLKEHGIVPENSPPPSPDTNSPVPEETVPSHLHPSNTVVQTPQQQLLTALQSQQVVLEQLSQNPQTSPSLPQLKFALTQDGSVILQQHNAFAGSPRLQSFVPSPHMQGRGTNNNVGSVIMPNVSTAISLPVVSSESSTARNHSTLIARLNAGPAVSVPDMSSLTIVSNIGGCTTTSITTTTITTSATNHVPLTVQSHNIIKSPITSTGYIVQRAVNAVPVTSERILYTEDANNTFVNVTSVISSTAQSVPNRINHINSNIQTVVVSSESPSKVSIQNTPKTVQSASSGNNSTSNSLNKVQVELDKSGHTRIVEIADNSGATTVPSHNLQAFSPHVPNQMLQKVQKEINDLSTLKYRTAEQQKTLQHLIAVQQKVLGPKSSSKSRNVQNQVQIKQENEIEKIVQRAPASQSSVVSNQSKSHNMQIKSILPQQQPVVDSSNQQMTSNLKPASSHSLHLVNLLKQAPNHPASLKHNNPVTTCVTSVNEIVSTTVSSSVVVTTPQRAINPVVNSVQPRLPIPYQPKPQPQSPQQTQHQVIVKAPKPTLPPPPPPPPQVESVRIAPNVVQLKGASPVKKVINSVPKTVLINEQLAKDQNGTVCPDIKTPFKSKFDACRRLMSYHVFNTKVPSYKQIAEADETFDMVSVQLLEKARILKHKYQILQLKESMRPSSIPDRVLLERLFIKDEDEALKQDKASVAEGKVLSLPPPPATWLRELRETPCDMPPPLTNCRIADKVIKKEVVEENDVHSTDYSDPLREDSDPAYKDDDNLEAPVIDSCADIVVPQHDDNCERSPPTLKRIVIKPENLSESDSEEPVNNKRFKYNSSIKSEPSEHDKGTSLYPVFKSIEKGSELKTNHKYHTRESFHSDNQIDDMVTEIRKELDMSPMETDDDDLDTVGSHVVDFEPPGGTNDLADFDPPVARTEESGDSNLLYNSSVRTNCEMKYDFEILGCSVWGENYVHHPSNESDAAVGNMMSDRGTPSDLDLSGLDGLDDHLEESEHGIPNGIQDVSSAESEINYIGYRIPKHQKRFSDLTVQPTSNCSNNTDQVQSAIKSIMGAPADNRSLFGADEMEFLPISKQSHNTHIADYGRSLETDAGVTSSESDAALDEAVRSILLR